MEMMRFQAKNFQLKSSIPVFWKRFCFPENLFQSYSISQTECYFENPSYRFLEESMVFLFAFI